MLSFEEWEKLSIKEIIAEVHKEIARVVIEGNGLTARQVSDIVGLNYNKVAGALDDLHIAGKVKKDGKLYYPPIKQG